MAKVVSQTIVITVSKLVKDDAGAPDMVKPAVVQELEAIMGELVAGCVAEAQLLPDE